MAKTRLPNLATAYNVGVEIGHAIGDVDEYHFYATHTRCPSEEYKYVIKDIDAEIAKLNKLVAKHTANLLVFRDRINSNMNGVGE